MCRRQQCHMQYHRFDFHGRPRHQKTPLLTKTCIEKSPNMDILPAMNKLLFFLFAAVAVLNSCPAMADDTVNLQWSICDSSPQVVLQKFGSSKTSSDKEEVITYYDTNPPTFDPRGIAFRTKSSDQSSLIKIHFDQVPSNVPASANCLWERYGNQEKYVCEIDNDLSGSSPWSADQLSFVGQYQAVNTSALVAFGPYNNPKWKIKFGGGLKGTFDTVEAQQQHIMELEIKTDKADDDDTYDQVTAILNQAGIVLCPVQEGKTTRLFKAMGLSH